MSGKKSQNPDTETILMALDQISQTIDVMTSVVGRLRNHMQEQLDQQEKGQQREPEEDMRPDRIIH